jgi:hypothetical protein
MSTSQEKLNTVSPTVAIWLQVPTGCSSQMVKSDAAVADVAGAFQLRSALPKGVLCETCRKMVAMVSLGTETSGGRALVVEVM